MYLLCSLLICGRFQTFLHIRFLFVFSSVRRHCSRVFSCILNTKVYRYIYIHVYVYVCTIWRIILIRTLQSTLSRVLFIDAKVSARSGRIKFQIGCDLTCFLFSGRSKKLSHAWFLHCVMVMVSSSNPILLTLDSLFCIK